MTPDPYDPETYADRMAVAFGYRRSRGERCLRLLVGKHCLRDCRCRTYHYLAHNVFDHLRVWLDGRGAHVLTAEPYGFEAAALAQVLADAAADGVFVTARTGPGVWNDGTTLITFRARARLIRGKKTSARGLVGRSRAGVGSSGGGDFGDGGGDVLEARPSHDQGASDADD